MDYYKILGVERGATEDDIKNAYRRKAKLYHPDINKDPGAVEEFRKINEAYEVLKKGDTRTSYDFNQDFSFNDLNDIFKHHSSFRTRQRNKDIALNYAITLEEAYTGVTSNIKYRVGGVTKEVMVDIPPGSFDGFKIHFPNRGHNDYPNVPPGNLDITVSLKPHTTFERNGVNLIYQADIDYFDSMLGTKIQVTCVDGSVVMVTIPENTSPDKMFKVRGKGMPNGSGFGDLLIYLRVSMPKLSSDDLDTLRKAVEMIKSTKKF